MALTVRRHTPLAPRGKKDISFVPGSIAASGRSILIMGAERVDGRAARLAMEVKWHSNWAISP